LLSRDLLSTVEFNAALFFFNHSIVKPNCQRSIRMTIASLKSDFIQLWRLPDFFYRDRVIFILNLFFSRTLHLNDSVF